MNERGWSAMLLSIVLFLGVVGFFAANMQFGEMYESTAGEGTAANASAATLLGFIPTTTNGVVFWFIVIPIAVLLIAILVFVVMP